MDVIAAAPAPGRAGYAFVFGAQITVHALAAATYPTALRAGVPLRCDFSGLALPVLLAAAATLTWRGRAASAD